MANGVPMFSAVYWPNILAPVVFNLKLTAGRLFWSKAGCSSVKCLDVPNLSLGSSMTSKKL